jgi:hypothetical protein
VSGHCAQSTDKMVRIDWMHHCHEDAVILLNSEVIEFTIKVIVKGQTCVLRLLISLICVYMRDSSLSSSTIVGNAPDWHALIWEVVDFVRATLLT